MKAKKSVAILITTFIPLVIALLSFAGCKQEDPKYDVAIKVANNYGMEWVFEPGVDELYYEFEYTCEDMTFGVDAYYVYGDPHIGDRWLDCAGAAINYFGGSYVYRSPEGEYSYPRIINERGEYSIHYGTKKQTAPLQADAYRILPKMLRQMITNFSRNWNRLFHWNIWKLQICMLTLPITARNMDFTFSKNTNILIYC